MAAFALVTTVGPQPPPATSTPGEPGRAADRPAFASLSYLTHRQVLRNPHIAKEGRHDPDIHSLRHCHAMFRPRTLVRGIESSLAFAKQLDEDLSLLGAEFQCPAELLRGVPRSSPATTAIPCAGGWNESCADNCVVGSTMSVKPSPN